EFTAICPKTGLPDFGTIYLSYRPDQFCLELKSLKEYITAYRSLGIFHENVVNRILEDLVAACKPHWMRVHGDYNVRGGIKTRVTASFKRQGSTTTG
ncbi:MAG: NADPH-dependent 7-cyano-7-deazaguanine reductase QueF, partial [Leptospiraceae bacterium]|nr:NADPH-dependent 7-cyano-7-deazaguanine reductase QueF [Leptospiraceae bacterium]